MVKQEIWSVQEKTLLNEMTNRLFIAGKNDLQQKLNKNLTALEYQAIALSLYPSILESNRIGGSERNLETLVSVLSERYCDESIFVMPTRAILTRSYEIGKINLLYMIKEITRVLDIKDPELDPFPFIMNRMLSIMTEDVLLDLLSGPLRSSAKTFAAAALAQIWEGRISAESIAFSPELRNMWMIRLNSIPVYGTLSGIHEYISLCKNADKVCLEYIYHASEFPDEASALEEFLFGLTYEELCVVKDNMSRSGKTCISQKEVASILGKETLYLSSRDDDPLQLYRFYNHRRRHALSRRFSRDRGPIRTFEENFMAFLLMDGGKKRKRKREKKAVS